MWGIRIGCVHKRTSHSHLVRISDTSTVDRIGYAGHNLNLNHVLSGRKLLDLTRLAVLHHLISGCWSNGVVIVESIGDNRVASQGRCVVLGYRH